MTDTFKEKRYKYLAKIFKIIKKYNDELMTDETKLSESEIKKIALDIEQQILFATKDESRTSGYLVYDTSNNYSESFTKFYENNICSVLANINKDNYIGNTYLIAKILANEIKPEEIAKKIVNYPYDLFPSENEKYINIIEKQEDASSDYGLDISSSHFCHRCKSDKCMATQAQLRSADESMTTLVTCLNCGNKWQY